MKKTSFFLLFLIIPVKLLIAQECKGVVLDAKNNLPLEGVNVYFDGTTIGTTTNEKGEYNLELDHIINASLIISYLGYDIQVFPPNKLKNDLTIKLSTKLTSLDEVLLNDDNWSIEKKRGIFKREFLGKQSYTKDCKIENIEDVVLKYSKTNNILYGYSNKPIIIKNKYLGYRVRYNLVDFEVKFKTSINGFRLTDVVIYSGTSVFEELNDKKTKKKYKKARELIYQNSLVKFIKSLVTDSLTENGFRVFIKDPSNKSELYFQTQPSKVFKTEILSNSFVKVTLLNTDKIVIRLDNLEQASLVLSENYDHFLIDNFGIHSPIEAILFSGTFGKQRIASLLPLNYIF